MALSSGTGAKPCGLESGPVWAVTVAYTPAGTHMPSPPPALVACWAPDLEAKRAGRVGLKMRPTSRCSFPRRLTVRRCFFWRPSWTRYCVPLRPVAPANGSCLRRGAAHGTRARVIYGGKNFRVGLGNLPIQHRCCLVDSLRRINVLPICSSRI